MEDSFSSNSTIDLVKNSGIFVKITGKYNSELSIQIFNIIFLKKYFHFFFRFMNYSGICGNRERFEIDVHQIGNGFVS